MKFYFSTGVGYECLEDIKILFTSLCHGGLDDVDVEWWNENL